MTTLATLLLPFTLLVTGRIVTLVIIVIWDNFYFPPVPSYQRQTGGDRSRCALLGRLVDTNESSGSWVCRRGRVRLGTSLLAGFTVGAQVIKERCRGRLRNRD
jgi:hypothetical protein